LDLPSFDVFFDTLSFEYGAPWDSESEEPIDRGHATMAFDYPLFEDYFGSLYLKQEDQWESESSEQLDDRHSCLDEKVLTAFTPTIDPISSMHKIVQVI
jgi:hypothetical protein